MHHAKTFVALLLFGLLLLAASSVPAVADTIPGTKTTAATPAWQARSNAYIHGHSGVQRWYLAFLHYRRYQQSTISAGKVPSGSCRGVWGWTWAKVTMWRESRGRWWVFNSQGSGCFGIWQLWPGHWLKWGYEWIRNPYHQFYIAAKLYRDSGSQPWGR